MVTDFFHHRYDVVVVGDGFFTFTFNFVGHFARLDHGIYMLLDEGGAVGNLFNEFQVLGRQFCSLLCGEQVFHLVDVVHQIGLILGGYGDDVVHGQISEHTGFDLDFLGICFPFHFVAGLEFLLRHDADGLEHPDAFRFQVVVEDDGDTCLAVQTAAGSFGFPLVAVTVAVKVDGFADFDVPADDFKNSGDFRLALFNQFVHIFLEFRQLLGKGGVQRNHGTGAVGFGTHGAELEAVAGKGERAGAVAVGIVYHQFRNLRDVQLHALLAAEADEVVLGTLFNVLQHLAQLLAQEGRDDGGRRLVGTQPVGVRRTGDGGFQQSVVAVYGHQRIHYEGDETQVLFGQFAGCVEQDAGIRAQRPVVVLATAVDALEGLFVQQYAEAVVACHFTHQGHDEHVVVYRQVAFLEDRSQLELVGSHFVVTGLDGDAEFQRFDFQLLHESSHTAGDGPEVMVFQLLVLGAVMAHQRASGHQQVGAGGVQSFVNQKIFLLPAQVGNHFLYFRIEIAAYVDGCLVYGTQGFQQRCLVVQRFAGIGNENSRDAKGVVHDECRGGGVPCRVTAGFECIADAAVRETGCIRFLLYKQFAGEFLHHAALAVVFHKSIVLFGSTFGQRMEPVRIVGRPHFHRPFLHTCGNLVGYAAVQRSSVVNHIRQFGIHLARQIAEHLLLVEYILGKIL